MGHLHELEFWPDNLDGIRITSDDNIVGRLYADDIEIATVAPAANFDGWQMNVYDGPGGAHLGHAMLHRPGHQDAHRDVAVCTWATYMTLLALRDRNSAAE